MASRSVRWRVGLVAAAAVEQGQPCASRARGPGQKRAGPRPARWPAAARRAGGRSRRPVARRRPELQVRSVPRARSRNRPAGGSDTSTAHWVVASPSGERQGQRRHAKLPPPRAGADGRGRRPAPAGSGQALQQPADAGPGREDARSCPGRAGVDKNRYGARQSAPEAVIPTDLLDAERLRPTMP